MVSCSQYEVCFKKSSIQSMNVCLNGMTHGPVSDVLEGCTPNIWNGIVQL